MFIGHNINRQSYHEETSRDRIWRSHPKKKELLDNSMCRRLEVHRLIDRD